MSEITVTCPNCQAELTADDQYIGMEAVCPDCGTSLVVPNTLQQQEPPAPRNFKLNLNRDVINKSKPSVVPENELVTLDNDD